MPIRATRIPAAIPGFALALWSDIAGAAIYEYSATLTGVADPTASATLPRCCSPFQAYQAGREAGLKEYCQESRGFQEGSQGNRYAGVCPADVETRFLQGYHEGRTLYDLESSLRATNRRLRDDEARIKQIELDLTDKAALVLATVTTREERARLLVETKQPAEERATLSAEIKDLEKKRVLQERQLAEAREELLAKR